MTDWIEHDGGPQPVADDVWVEVRQLYQADDRDLATWIAWDYKLRYRILNQHLIDAARREGIRLGLEAAAKVATEKVEKRIGVPCPDGVEGCLAFHFRREYRDKSAFHIAHDLRALNPDTIAREAVLDQLTREAQAQGMGYDHDDAKENTR